MKKQLILLAIAGIMTGGARSQDLVTGPAKGAPLTPALAYGVGGAHAGPHAGSEFDVASEIGQGPGAILFMHELTRNILPVVRGLDQFGSEYSLKGFKTFTLMLSADRTAGESRLKAVNGSLKLRNPIVLSLDGAEGPGNYALNRKAALSLVLVNKGKVVRTHAYTDVNAEDEGTLRGWVEELVGRLPETVGDYRELAEASLPRDAGELRSIAVEQAVEIRRLQAQLKRLREQSGGRYDMRSEGRNATSRMRGEGRAANSPRGGGRDLKPAAESGVRPQRQGRPPSDAQLNALLRSFIRKTNDFAEAERVYGEIVARAKESEALRDEAVEMFKLMLSYRDRYGTERAQELAEAFLKERMGPEGRGR